MPTKQEELIALENQKIIVETYAKWAEKQNRQFEIDHMQENIALTDLEIQKEDLLELSKTKVVGSSAYNIIFLIYMAFIYAIPSTNEKLQPYIFWLFVLGLALFTFCFFRRTKKEVRPFASNLFCVLSSSLSFYIVVYALAMFGGGLNLALSVPVREVTTFEVYEVLRPIYLVLTCAFALSLLVISPLRVGRSIRLVRDSKKELEQIEKEIETIAGKLKLEQTKHKDFLNSRCDEFFAKYKLLLPELTNNQIDEVKEILNRSDVNSLNEALVIYYSDK